VGKLKRYQIWIEKCRNAIEKNHAIATHGNLTHYLSEKAREEIICSESLLESLKTSQQEMMLHRLALNREYPAHLLHAIENAGPPLEIEHREVTFAEAQRSSDDPTAVNEIAGGHHQLRPIPKTAPTSTFAIRELAHATNYQERSLPQVDMSPQLLRQSLGRSGGKRKQKKRKAENSTLTHPTVDAWPPQQANEGSAALLQNAVVHYQLPSAKDEVGSGLQRPLFAAAFMEQPGLSKTENWRGFCLHKLSMIRLGLKSPSRKPPSLRHAWRAQRKAAGKIQRAYRQYCRAKLQKRILFAKVEAEKLRALVIREAEEDARRQRAKERSDVSSLMNTRIFSFQGKTSQEEPKTVWSLPPSSQRHLPKLDMHNSRHTKTVMQLVEPICTGAVFSHPHTSATRIQRCWVEYKSINLLQASFFGEPMEVGEKVDRSSGQDNAAALLIASHSKTKAVLSLVEKEEKSKYVPGTFLQRRRKECALIIQGVARLWLARLHLANVKLDIQRRRLQAEAKKAATSIQTRYRANRARDRLHRERQVRAMDEERTQMREEATKKLQAFSRAKQAKVCVSCATHYRGGGGRRGRGRGGRGGASSFYSNEVAAHHFPSRPSFVLSSPPASVSHCTAGPANKG
jgi:hypothetical protein